MRLTDTHCHLNFSNYQTDLAEVLARSEEAGVKRILVPAIDLQSSQEVVDLSQKYPGVYAAVGVHPNSGRSWQKGSRARIRRLAARSSVVAIGEIGLDYYRDHTPRETQREVFIRQLELARELDLPVVLHVRNRSAENRDCIADLLDILEDWLGSAAATRDSQPRSPGVLHSFSGNLQEGVRAVNLGFYLGITGPVTYKNAAELRDVVREIDISHLLVETDGPFLAPVPFRGKRNEPAHVRLIVDKIGEIKSLDPREVAEFSYQNAADLFMWEC